MQLDMKKIPNFQLRSEETQELMGEIPPIIVRMGISIIFLLLILFLVASYFLRYPEYWETKVEISPQNATFEIKSEYDGVIKYITNKHTKVYKNDTLVILNTKKGNIILKTPITGFIYQCCFFHNNQKIDKNDILFIVSPYKSIKLTGIAYVPLKVIKNIPINKNIEIITPDGQTLRGNIIKKSTVLNPKNNLYAIEIEFSNMQKQNSILSKITGKTKIEYENKTLFKRLIEKYNRLSK